MKCNDCPHFARSEDVCMIAEEGNFKDLEGDCLLRIALIFLNDIADSLDKEDNNGDDDWKKDKGENEEGK